MTKVIRLHSLGDGMGVGAICPWLLVPFSDDSASGFLFVWDCVAAVCKLVN